MIDICNMIKCENIFPMDFANVEEKPYGFVFYNMNNPSSYDSNHAIILKFDINLRSVIKDIITFYEERELIPRIYHAFQPDEDKLLYPLLKEMGFEIEKLDNNYLFFEKQYEISYNHQLTVKLVNNIDSDIKDIIYSAENDEDWGEWTIKVLESLIKSKKFYLFIGFVNSKPVTMSSLTVMDKLSRVDHVITHNNFRKKGYGKEVFDYLIKYHKSISSNKLYLYTSNSIALRMYENMGFTKIDLERKFWLAEKR